MKYISTILFLLLLIYAHGQAPVITNYKQNIYVINPAYHGIEKFKQIQTINKIAWRGFDNYYIHQINTSAFFGETIPSNPLQNSFHLSNPAATENITENRKPKHGYGLSLSSEGTKIYKSTNLNLGYSVHIPISTTVNFSAGLGFNIGYKKFDPSNFQVRNPQTDLFYQSLINQKFIYEKYYQIIPALLLSSKTFDIGISYYSTKLNSESTNKETAYNNKSILLTANKEFTVSKSFLINSGLLIDYHFSKENYNTRLYIEGIYKSLVGFGAIITDNYTSSLVKLNILEKISVYWVSDVFIYNNIGRSTLDNEITLTYLFIK
ncbi:MAG: type IX secretion system membrane protein PorP/SprF [Cyclobacteriaceae bacterium]|nr:type IX secretion system membrane protein PorP/SprF [Cyclobacteriaceae bacterium]